MNIFFIILHTFCALLIMVVILMQSGRGGGLTEAFSSAESIFGPKTNVFMVRVTVVLASIFLVTSVVLAHLSAKKEQSLIPEKFATQPMTLVTNATLPPVNEPASEPAK